MNSPRSPFNFAGLPLEMQEEVVRHMPLNDKANMYKTSHLVQRIPYDCCEEPTMEEIGSYFVRQIQLLMNPKTNHLKDWKGPTNTFRFVDYKNKEYTISIHEKGQIYLGYERDYDYKDINRKIELHQLNEILKQLKFPTKYIRDAIELFRPILYNRISCMNRDPDFPDKCLLKILPKYLIHTDSWKEWDNTIYELSELLRNRDLFYSQAYNQLSTWQTAGGRQLKFRTTWSDQKVDSNLVKQWLTNWIKSLSPSDLKPLFPYALPYLPLPPQPPHGPLISMTFPNIPPPRKYKRPYPILYTPIKQIVS